MRPKAWDELLRKALTLAEEFEKHFASNLEWASDEQIKRWEEELNELRLGLIFLLIIPNSVGGLDTPNEYASRSMRAAKAAIESLERLHSSILAIDFKRRHR